MGARGLDGYQLHVAAAAVPAGVPRSSVVLIQPSDPHEPSSWLEALSASGLTAADMRTQMLLHPDVSDPVASLLFVSTMSGFAGRVADMALAGTLVNSASVYRAVAAFRDEGKVEDPARVAVSGAGVLEGALHLDFGQPFPPDLVSRLRYARSAALMVDARSGPEMLMAMVVLAGIRELRRKPRFPLLLTGDFSLSEDGEFLLPDGSFDLERVRRDASALRREIRVDVRDAVVDAVVADEHLLRMSEAAAKPLEGVLSALGASSSGEAWHCPRPDRHTNGDRNPSAQLSDDGFLCHRCDVEPVDALRLVMDVRGFGPEDAVKWLLTLD